GLRVLQLVGYSRSNSSRLRTKWLRMYVLLYHFWLCNRLFTPHKHANLRELPARPAAKPVRILLPPYIQQMLCCPVQTGIFAHAVIEVHPRLPQLTFQFIHLILDPCHNTLAAYQVQRCKTATLHQWLYLGGVSEVGFCEIAFLLWPVHAVRQ